MAPPKRSAPRTEAIMLIAGEALEAMQHMQNAGEWVATARLKRDQAIAELRRHGWTIRECAEFTQLSVGTIVAIDKAQGVTHTPKHRSE